ncbi:unnamed protein product [Soboliphyme baturini]|uniref:RING-type domain-containing protein n=1 Tax=Soboliphyme baturini TaxID=241478 RepID=A0A183IHV0_9BILA|nr:unnamed protein product [Soboliphyme baturini]
MQGTVKTSHLLPFRVETNVRIARPLQTADRVRNTNVLQRRRFITVGLAQEPAVHRHSMVNLGMNAKDIELLPTMEISEDVDFEQSICVICREEFRHRERVTLLPCKHVFHPTCIKQWLGGKGICPSCRQPASFTTAQK